MISERLVLFVCSYFILGSFLKGTEMVVRLLCQCFVFDLEKISKRADGHKAMRRWLEARNNKNSGENIAYSQRHSGLRVGTRRGESEDGFLSQTVENPQ